MIAHQKNTRSRPFGDWRKKLSRAMCQNPKTSLSGSGNNSHVRDQVVYLENAGKLSFSRSGHGRKMTNCFYTLKLYCIDVGVKHQKYGSVKLKSQGKIETR